MPVRRVLILSLAVLCCLAASARNKKKASLPLYVLQAHTAWVMVDPQAGVDVTNPTANRQAIDDVNEALARWGRLMPVADLTQADLIIVIRKGNGKAVQPTIAGTPMNRPPSVMGQRTDSGFNASARMGGPQPEQNHPHPQMETGSPDDTFAVYRGESADVRDPNEKNPLEAPPVWRYAGKDALEAPSVPAVDRFRKAIEESEKALATP